jgi:LacI family transcriptional regulator
MYLLSRGHKTFCYISRTEGLQQARGEGFTRTLARHGFTCTMLDPPDDALDTVSTRRAADAFSARLAQMPKPVAILCHNDWLGWVVAEHCRAIGLRIPEEISLMGVDNDVTICTLCEPPLSSVQTAAERIGYEAAQVLDLLLEGRAPASRALRVPPVRVVERRSTDAMLAQDEVVARALRYMQQHLREAGGVLELSRRVGCSRRNLERRFVNATGSTPAHSWARLRVNEAQRLLAETDLGMGDVAHLSGFTSGVQLSVTFRRYTGLSPSQFRRRAQP